MLTLLCHASIMLWQIKAEKLILWQRAMWNKMCRTYSVSSLKWPFLFKTVWNNIRLRIMYFGKKELRSTLVPNWKEWLHNSFVIVSDIAFISIFGVQKLIDFLSASKSKMHAIREIHAPKLLLTKSQTNICPDQHFLYYCRMLAQELDGILVLAI